MNEEICKHCKYWQNYKDRFTACISGKTSNTERNRIELRSCDFNPPPTIQSRVRIYTDEDYSCSEFLKVD